MVYLRAGTSCSAPIWGGIIGLLNANRVKAGKSVLGWVPCVTIFNASTKCWMSCCFLCSFFNPALYSMYPSNTAAFTDIVTGTFIQFSRLK